MTLHNSDHLHRLVLCVLTVLQKRGTPRFFFFQQHSHLFEFGVLISPKLGCSFLYADHLLHLTHCLSGTTSNHLVLLERRDDGGWLLLCRDLHLITQDYMMVPTTECSVPLLVLLGLVSFKWLLWIWIKII